MTRSNDDTQPETITAKWTTSFGSSEQYFGTITLDDAFALNFPILRSQDEVPPGTSILWGVSDNLRKCTAVTLPFGPHGSASTAKERSRSARSPVSHLLIGNIYVADPSSNFVSEVVFTPQPNRELHISQLYKHFQPDKDIVEIKFSPSADPKIKSFPSAHYAHFIPNRSSLFEKTVEPLAATIVAWIGGSTSFDHAEGERRQSCVSFAIRFHSSQTLEAATDEALRFCAFLSFIAHQYTYPDEFYLRPVNDEQPLRLVVNGIRKASKPDNNWVRHTLVLPDEQPEQFCQALEKWYATNDRCLRSRFLYRHSMQEPNTYSSERFLQIFQALEGLINVSEYKFLTATELDDAEAALRKALPDAPKLDALIKKLRSSNMESPRYVLKRELPVIFGAARIAPSFNIDEFVDRIYERRNKAAHGGTHLDREPLEGLMRDTALVTAIFLIIECDQLGVDARDALSKFKAAHLYLDLPLKNVI